MNDDPKRIHPHFNPHLQPEEGAIEEGPVWTKSFAEDCKAGVVIYIKDGYFCVKIHDPDKELTVVKEEGEEDTIFRFKAKDELN